MNEKSYNGWTNYETWCVNLWMDNEEPSYTYWRERTKEIYRETGSKDAAIYSLAVTLKDEHEEGQPEGISGVYADLLGASLSEVNWHEIAASWVNGYLDDNPEPDPEDDDDDDDGLTPDTPTDAARRAIAALVAEYPETSQENAHDYAFHAALSAGAELEEAQRIAVALVYLGNAGAS